MSLFELLKYFPGRLEPVATVVIPGIVITLLFLLPFLDRRPDREPARRPLVIGSFVFVYLGITLLTILGFRSTPAPSSQTQQATARPGAALLAGQRGPVMVEDVFKNVQALKGITVDEFMGTMGLMSASLGLCCSDCHPGAGTESVKWEDDSNPRKVTARKMVLMMQAINRDNFSGRQVVTCWTCHHLRDVPLQTPRLDQLYSEALTELDDVVSKADGVPAPTEVIDKYLQAIGGAEKAAGITSIVATGKVEAFGSFGGGGNFEFFAQAPDKRAMHSHLPSGESIRTFDGRTRLVCDPARGRAQVPLDGWRARRRTAGRPAVLSSADREVADGAARGPQDRGGGQGRLPRAGKRPERFGREPLLRSGIGVARADDPLHAVEDWQGADAGGLRGLP